MRICKVCFRDANDMIDHIVCFEKFMVTDLQGWLEYMDRKQQRR